MRFSKLISRTALGFMAIALMLPVSAKAAEFTDAQRAEIQTMFKDFLSNSGGDVLESVNKYQAALAEQDKAEATERAKNFMSSLKNQKNLPIAGNPDGDVTIVEFFDYNCGYCHKALEELQTVIKDDKNVKVVFMDMPILGPASVVAAKWSLAAQKQGKYFEYHQAIMNHKGNKDDASFEKLAKDIGLDVKKLKKDKDSDEIGKLVDARIKSAQDIGIRGTPGFIIADQLQPGYIPAAQMKVIIAEARANKS